MVDSGVRVSRRDAEDHFESIAPAGGVPQSGPRQQACPAALTHTPVRRDTKGASGHPVYAAASTLILCSSLSAISLIETISSGSRRRSGREATSILERRDPSVLDTACRCPAIHRPKREASSTEHPFPAPSEPTLTRTENTKGTV
jgi:hypothetical protein